MEPTQIQKNYQNYGSQIQNAPYKNNVIVKSHQNAATPSYYISILEAILKDEQKCVLPLNIGKKIYAGIEKLNIYKSIIFINKNFDKYRINAFIINNLMSKKN